MRTLVSPGTVQTLARDWRCILEVRPVPIR